ncbi:PIN domain-containing protein [Thermosulfurimonas sp.]|uniref:type II toxin-antitoxin system VapC family toxin n=1 Tax=Thermosulfurimonas sp. TaxID=2080236 RepID=UPI0025E95DF3|nr:PIN domain-containing protein [Thermosulfurimonas sp.]
MKNEPVLADTSFLVALLNKKDVHHPRAIKLMQILKKTSRKVVITDVVVNETLGVLKRRLKEKNGRDFGVLARKVLQLWEKERVFFYLYVSSSWEEITKLVLESDGELNFHDALLVVGARKTGIEHIATFDQDFKDYLRLVEI